MFMAMFRALLILPDFVVSLFSLEVLLDEDEQEILR